MYAGSSPERQTTEEHMDSTGEAIFKLADTNQDGFVSYHEFARG